MADLVVTALNVAEIFPRTFAEIYPGTAGEALTAGDVVYEDANGRLIKASAAAAGVAAQPRGVALETVANGQAVSILKRGHVAGFTISQAYATRLFLSNTAGKIGDAAGTVSAPLGRVVALSDPERTKVVYVDFNWANQN
jgi:hypothetical protein